MRALTVVPEHLRQVCGWMADEISPVGQRLLVSLAPSDVPDIAQRGGKKRVVDECNPDWYRQFCAAYTSHRKRPRQRKKHDTRIKRLDTFKLLRNMESVGETVSTYAEHLLEIAQEIWEEEQAAEAEAERRMSGWQDDEVLEPVSEEELAAVPF